MSDQPIPELRIERDKDEYRISVAIVNDGPEPIDPGVRRSTLLIDGQPAPSWSLAVMNGSGTTSERHLDPGQRVEITRILPATALGGDDDHEVVAEIEGARSNAVRTR